VIDYKVDTLSSSLNLPLSATLMSLSPNAPLEVLRDHIVPAALSNYIGKIVTVCGMFLVCYDWSKFCRCPFELGLILFLSNISGQRGMTM